MSRQGLKIALQHGQLLPAFSSLDEAKQSLLARRDAHLEAFQSLTVEASGPSLDYSPESLKALEKWYFQLYESDGFATISAERETFEQCMAFYFGEVAKRNAKDGEWVVEEFAFIRGKYEIGVCSGNMKVMVGSRRDHFKTPDNKRHQSLYRQYKQWFE